MENLLKNIYVYFILFFISLFLFSGCSLNKDFDTDEDILRIGFFGPLTSQATSYGLSIRDMVNFSITEINLNGGIDGKKLKLEIYGAKCSRVGGKSALQNLIDDGVKIVIGGVCSDETLGAAKLADENGIFLFSPSSSAQAISNHKHIFRNTLSVEYLGYKLAEKAYYDGSRKVTIINEFSSYTESYKKYFTEKFIELGGEVVSVDVFDSFEDDLSFLYENIEKSDPDSIILFFQSYLSIKHFFLDLISTDIDLPMYGGDLIINDLIVKDYMEIMDGIKIVSMYHDESDNFNNLKNDSSEFAGFDIFENNNPAYLISSYESVYILKYVIENFNCDIDDVNCISNGFLKLDNFNSMLGNISFDKYGDVNLKPVIYELMRGEFILLEND